jgi:phosphoribosylformylglycinamidine synthase
VTIKKALENLGYDEVAEVRSGKVFTLTFRDDVDGDLQAKAQEICEKLLSNPVIENFEVEEG